MLSLTVRNSSVAQDTFRCRQGVVITGFDCICKRCYVALVSSYLNTGVIFKLTRQIGCPETSQPGLLAKSSKRYLNLLTEFHLLLLEMNRVMSVGSFVVHESVSFLFFSFCPDQLRTNLSSKCHFSSREFYELYFIYILLTVYLVSNSW